MKGRVLALTRFDNIIAIQSDSGRIVGFHARNLQVATLDAMVWDALQEPTQAPEDVKAEILSWNSEVDADVTDAASTNGIRTLYVNVAQVCNMRCSYCAAGGDGTFGAKTAHIDLEKMKSQLTMLLSRVPEGESFGISFFGGEPLIYPNTVRAIADHARLLVAGRDVRLRFDITTNATLVTPKIAEMLADLNASVKVSIDAPPELNDLTRKMTSGGGSSTLVLRGLENLFAVKSRLAALASNSVFGPHHLDVVATYEFLRRFGFDSFRFDYAAGPDDETYSPLYVENLLRAARLAWEIGGEKELRRFHIFDHHFRILDDRVRIQNHCGAGKSTLQVDTKGRFYPCVWSANDPGDQIGHDLELNDEALARYSKTLIELNNCGTCWARHICGGGCMYVNRLRTGDKHTKDEQFCNRTRALIARGIEYYEQSRYEREGV